MFGLSAENDECRMQNDERTMLRSFMGRWERGVAAGSFTK